MNSFQNDNFLPTRSFTSPIVGVAVLIRRNNKLLLGKRRCVRGFGTWSSPGGHLEPSETFADCARREVDEEVGVTIANLQLCTITNDIFHESFEHYVTVVMTADYVGGHASVREPDVFVEWKWFNWDRLPEPLCMYLRTLVETGFNPFLK